MQYRLISFMISILITTGCYGQKAISEHSGNPVPDVYLQFSPFTDPGEYAYLYDNLPDSLPALCSLIKSQFIHPFAELSKYRDQIPKERWNEMYRYSSVKSILAGLVSYDSAGLTLEREPKNRLVLGCQQNAILLASILKHRGIPARVRYGHVTYLIPDFHTSHTICEVWNENDKRWMLVDPSTNRIDFSHEYFDFSYEAWLQMRKGEIDTRRYGIPNRYSGFVSIVGKVNTDLASVLGTEYPVNQYAPMLEYAFENEDLLTPAHIETLNTVCELMKSLDADNIVKLREIYTSTPEIQLTKTFDLISGN